MTAREASHAGSWYESKGPVLASQLQSWLTAAAGTQNDSSTDVRAIIAPHAGYSYSGPVAAHAYQHLNPANIDTIFVLGPSHHHHTLSCLLSQCATYNTPLGPLTLDAGTIAELKSTGMFGTMSVDVDQAEHSIEMHLPYIAHRMSTKKFTIVPILVGSLSASDERKFGQLLSEYFAKPNVFFVISSDFCHWGQRFRYTWYDSSHGEIHQSIEWLDRQGMALIEAKSVRGFNDYDNHYHNTICGRHPIGVLLNIVDTVAGRDKLAVKFVAYAQSSAVKRKSESSVSYAAAIVFKQ